MNFNNNPYYSPELCGLEIFTSIDTAGSYEFDIFVIWKKLDDNTLWYAQDSGCSCPTPFEDFNSLSDLTPITEETWHGFKEALKNHYNIELSVILDITQKVKIYLNLVFNPITRYE
jgi:hypothetical protein